MTQTAPDVFEGFPVRPGDWVSDGTRCARVRDIRLDRDEIIAHLVVYTASGARIGRESPSMGGPKAYEPSVPLIGWVRVARPRFPLQLTWVQKDGGPFSVARFNFGPKLAPRRWFPEAEQERPVPAAAPNEIIEILMQIARGHNDPRTLASDLLTRLGIPYQAESHA